MSVQRYDYHVPTHQNPVMMHAPEGGWVRHEDYATLEAEHAKLKEERDGWRHGAGIKLQSLDHYQKLIEENAALKVRINSQRPGIA